MKVLAPARPQASPIPGIAHVTRASHGDGLSSLSVWHQTLQAGAGTPVHRHDCDEVVMCTAGWGEVRSDGQVQRFTADCTVVLPAHREHQIVNAGPGPLEIVGVFSASPVVTRDPEGKALALPWQS